VGADEILVTHWDGEGSLSQLIDETLAGESQLIGDKRHSIFAYIGYEDSDRRNLTSP
jgi:hypothetical protein